MLTPAIVFISSALVFYTFGVWAERLQGTLRPWHVVAFGLGLACDATGTEFMRRIACSGGASFSSGTGEVLGAVMAITGALALLLMAVHFVWALVVVIRGTDRAKTVFHRFSILVWAIWLVPYFTGMASSMIG
ncbi:HsmA family protein [Brevibacterium sp. BRM-1]|uniref:HsmA family protein n=1 Tax=Brevibacterium sp. BRM-1 TaxID=2999062 RepID=UPI00227F1ED1|nr:HsmA family protein [Brevibacterium sp. BRM-1]WAL40136.1 HsmA family protein [Brevibacterium sp. BRM-1]